MKREKVIESVNKELRILKGKNVADLMRKKDSERLCDIAQEIDYFYLTKYLEDYDVVSLYLKLEEIPDDMILELCFFINQSRYNDDAILDDREEVENELFKEKEDSLEWKIALLMEDWDLNDYSLEELLR